MEGLTVIAVAVAVSVDSFLVGLSYGARGLRVPVFPTLGIGIMSGAVILVALWAGDMLSMWLGQGLGRILGGLILMGAAARIAFTPSEASKQPGSGVLSILRDPSLADKDSSGHISPGESLSLGLALSVDSFGVGVGVSAGVSPSLWLPLSACLVTMMALTLGLRLGRNALNWSGSPLIRYLPVAILLVLGLSRLFPGSW